MSPQLKENLANAVIPNTDDRFLPARAVWERYGVTSMSLYRWLADEKSGFPKPVYFGRFRHWRFSELLAWEASRPKVGKPFRASADFVEAA
jgi:predicted DNA-binding transcriptional regulator AlpA